MAKSSKNEIIKDIHDDLGFGTKVYGRTKRLINKDGHFNIRRTRLGWLDLHIYQWLVLIS